MTLKYLLDENVDPSYKTQLHRRNPDDETPLNPQKCPPFDFPLIHISSWPANLSLRREDMYGDDGR